MENQPPTQPPSLAARPWFRLTSIRSPVPVATPAAPPVAVPSPPQPVPVSAPAPELPLRRLGSLLIRSPPAVSPPPQEPPAEAPAQPQTGPPPTAPVSPLPPPSPGVPSRTVTPLATATAQDQQPPRQALPSTVAPSPAARAPSPPAPAQPPSPRLPEPIPATSPAVRPQQQRPPRLPSPVTAVSPPPPVTIVPPAPAPSPRLPSPPLHPEPETKPVVTVVTIQPALTREPTSAPYKNGNGGKTKLGGTQGDQLRGATPPPPSPTTSPKKLYPVTAAAAGVVASPRKKKSDATDEAESRMRVLTLAGENTGAYMNLGRGTKGQGRHLTQTQPAQSVQKAELPVAPGTNGGKSSTDVYNYPAALEASKWKAGEASAKPMAALVNSNVQSVNNSIMFNSSCTQQSPGVHITLSSGSRRASYNRQLGDSNGGSGGDDHRRSNH